MFPEFPVSRRVFLALGASAIVAACSSDNTNSPAGTSSASSTSGPPSTTSPSSVSASTTTAPPIAPYSQPGWLVTENGLEGTDAWRIDIDVAPTKRPSMPGRIEGFADTTSARPGQTVNLHVTTVAPTWHVEAYRMGFYGGKLGRLVWKSKELEKPWQFEEPSMDPDTRMHVSNLQAATSFVVDDAWPPGSYLLKLVSSEGGA